MKQTLNSFYRNNYTTVHLFTMSDGELCYNRSCGRTYNPRDNPPDSTDCVHHPGAPYFHEGYKGWTCCSKKTTDFTEFLNTPGCTRGPHSREKPIEPEAITGKKDDRALEVQLAEINGSASGRGTLIVWGLCSKKLLWSNRRLRSNKLLCSSRPLCSNRLLWSCGHCQIG